MHLYNDITLLPVFRNAVITIGTFDGVHEGHSRIISQLINEAELVKGTPVVITFYPHPKQVVGQYKKPVFVLNTQEEKYRLLESKGIDHIVCVPFTKTFAEQPPETYIKDFIVEKFHPHTIIIGYDHRFGRNREGDYKLLEDAAHTYQYKVKEIPEYILKSSIISSTKIREALLTGEIDIANEFLGYAYTLSGKVTEGKKLGRTLGYPTANMAIHHPSKLIPAKGIYAVMVKTEAVPGRFKGMMSIGTNPTVDGKVQTLEVNIFDFDADIYNTDIEVSFIKKLRNEEKFNSLQELVVQMKLDKIDTLNILKEYNK
ncbi:MAG: bifunctional riboflavin kinase/FAD synthetase [Ferruginibacter sp.]